MSGKKINLADIIKLVFAAARAAVGEYTGLAVEGARHSRKIISFIITIVIVALMLFTTFIYAASKQIPGFEMLYEIGRRINQPSDEMSDTNAGNADSSNVVKPDQTLGGGS